MPVRNVDTLVVGLGAMGSAALYHLALDGAHAVGLEQYSIGHDRGASHGHSRAFRVGYHDPIYIRMARASMPLWRELESRCGERLLTMCGMLFYSRPGNAALRRNIAALKATGIEHMTLDRSEVAARYPALRLPEEAEACFTPDAGFLDPTRSVSALVAQARLSGAIVVEGAKVQKIDLAAKSPQIWTASEHYQCRILVITPGPWAPYLLADLGVPIRITRQQKYYFVPKEPRLYGPDCIPVFTDYDTFFYGFPLYGPGIKVADDNLGPDTTPETIDRTLDLNEKARLLHWLQLLMPKGDFTFAQGATCMYSLTPDRDFLIGFHPLNPSVIVAAGFSGHGFKFATLVGRIVADLALTGKTPYAIDRFRPDRFKEKTSVLVN